MSPLTVCAVATPTRKLLTGSIVRSADQPGLLHSAGTGNPSLEVGAGVTGGGVLSWRMRIPSILRQGHSAIFHIGIAVVVGAAAGTVVGAIAGWQYAPAAGWIATAVVYLIWTWASVAKMTAPAIEIVVQQRHPARGPADTIVVIASIASLGGVANLLIAGTAKGPDATIAAAVGFLSVIAAWLVVHTVYTLRYAVLYYTEPVGGIDFNQEEKPTFADFAYLAFTIAVTFGVTDTAVKNRLIRKSVLQHSMVSYLFGTVILAITVQVITTLSGL